MSAVHFVLCLCKFNVSFISMSDLFLWVLQLTVDIKHKGWFTNVVAVIHIAMRVIFSGFWSWSLAFLGSATYILLLRYYQFDIIMDFYWFLMQFLHQVVQKKLHFRRQHFEPIMYTIEPLSIHRKWFLKFNLHFASFIILIYTNSG